MTISGFRRIAVLLTDRILIMLLLEGLGSIYGDHELRDVMDRQAEHKIIDSALWKHFERLA